MQPWVRTGLFILGGFGPFIAGIALTWVEGHEIRSWLAKIFRVSVPGRYYILALSLPVALVIVATIIHVWFFDGTLTPAAVAAPVEYPLYLISIILFGGGQEEPGWRGYLLPRLQETYSALTAALLIGVVWSGWHLPLFVLPGTLQSEIALWLYIPQVVSMSVVLTWLTNASRGSVLPAILLHAGGNAIVNYYPAGGVTGAISPVGYGLLTATIAVTAVVLVLVYNSKTLAPVTIE